ncbi:hypothetical protein [Streptomyces anulatus]|uniref:hypothetical protein n=1 Tax=Streptomyces anulatus TaxID=1892 RepID=UPI0033CF6962
MSTRRPLGTGPVRTDQPGTDEAVPGPAPHAGLAAEYLPAAEPVAAGVQPAGRRALGAGPAAAP